ncbi:MAG: endonuclease III [Candidatus Korobacteraceae bacterium]
MARGIMLRQPSRSGRHDKVASSPVRARGGTTKSSLQKPAKITPPKRAKKIAPAKPTRKAAGGAVKSYNPTAPERVNEILERLDQRYPGATCALHHDSAWELLVATILSAQCTDVRVNMVTPIIFEKYPTPEAFAALEPEDLEPDIRSTGFFRNKSKSVVGAARKLISEFGGQVPRTMDELLQLPGVARKTANVVLGTWYKIADGVVVDTHVQRISRRLELTKNEEPQKIEQNLMKVIPRDKWIIFAHQIILHGRGLCVARKPKCADCPLENLCHAADKTWSTVEIHKSAKP